MLNSESTETSPYFAPWKKQANPLTNRVNCYIYNQSWIQTHVCTTISVRIWNNDTNWNGRDILLPDADHHGVISQVVRVSDVEIKQLRISLHTIQIQRPWMYWLQFRDKLSSHKYHRDLPQSIWNETQRKRNTGDKFWRGWDTVIIRNRCIMYIWIKPSPTCWMTWSPMSSSYYK